MRIELPERAVWPLPPRPEVLPSLERHAPRLAAGEGNLIAANPGGAGKTALLAA